MKKWFIILLSVLLIALLALPAFATDTSEGEEGTSTSEGSEGSESVSVASVDTSSATATNQDGITFTIPDCVIGQMGNYKYLACVASSADTSAPYAWYCFDNLDFSETTIDYPYFYICGPTARNFVTDTWCDFTLESSRDSTPVSWVLYSNFDIVTSSGTVLRSSDTGSSNLSYTVSFDTGFDDLTIDSQSSDSLSLPDPEYDGYIFAGWYLDDEFTQPYTSDFVFTGDTVLFARWLDDGGMAFFSGSVFSAFTTIFACEPVFYLVSLMGLALIVGIIKSWFDARC